MCTRVFNNRNEKYLTTARNMDWKTQLPTSIYTFGSGLVKYALSGEEPEKLTNWHWTSKYSSIVAMVGNDKLGYAASDGINSQGLVANALYDSVANYKLKGGKTYKHLNVLRWVQYVLDNFKTAEDVKDAFENSEIELVQIDVPGSDSPAKLHLSVSDIKGYNTIVEVYDGTYHVHYSEKYNVMTNEPNFEIQLQLNQYWLWQWSKKNEFPSHTIPGGPFPSDRYERATYYYQQLKSPKNEHESLAQAKSVVANACVPIGMQGFGEHPNIAPTIWTTLSDHRQLKYYFYNARTPNTVWIEMNSELRNVNKIDLVVMKDKNEFTNVNYVGCINEHLKPTEDPYS